MQRSIVLNLSDDAFDALDSLTSLILINLWTDTFSWNLTLNPGKLTNLEYLYLGNVQGSGSIPTSITQLNNLTALSKTANKDITGTIPSNLFSSLPKLQHLDLRGTSISGSIPDIPPGHPLTNLVISHNSGQMNGTIPEGIYGNGLSILIIEGEPLLVTELDLSRVVAPTFSRLRTLHLDSFP
mmetsp:Transcript_6832/g.7483  ORF Transcript_6832/g.7483 Transcript_6832/m.7483 type:complete len:183 (+) Transcript_6832:208-756(+)